MAGGGGGEEGEFGLQIAPLLDVLFVLLLFFMVNAGLQEQEAELTIQLPGGGRPGEGAPQTPIRLGIEADGVIRWEDAPIADGADYELTRLIARLKLMQEEHDDLPVIITPQPAATHQRVIDVLSACNEAKVKNLAFGSPR